MTELVQSLAEIIHNVDTLYRYGLSNGKEQQFHDARIKNGKVFVAVQRDGQYHFAPSKFAGYSKNNLDHETKLQERDGGLTNVRIESLTGKPIQEQSTKYSEIDGAYLKYCAEHGIEPSQHQMKRRYWLIEGQSGVSPKFYWTKVWGQPGDPSEEALLFNSLAYRERARNLLNRGDIVVYLTSDSAYADPMFKGRVAGAVEVAGEPVSAHEFGIVSRALKEHFRENGDFRWPYGLTISRAWRVIDNESNDNLIKGHAEKNMQGAAFVHEMQPDEVARFLSLRVKEQGEDALPEEIFRVSQKRPWHQKAGTRASSEIDPGRYLYVAWISDDHGLTVKVGSGKHLDRIGELNKYRRPSQGEMLWSLAKGMLYEFPIVESARAAEDYLLKKAFDEGFGSSDHGEFLVNIGLDRLSTLFSEAVEVGLARSDSKPE